jgi:L-2,4-diaminobutyric acid acetyltransferase
VTPSNVASETLFRRFGARHGAPVATDELFAEELFPPGHEAEVRFRIGPLAGDAA